MNFERLEGLMADLMKGQKESREEFDRRMQEADRRTQETDRQMKETDRRIKDLSKQVGGIDRNIGFHAEQYFQNALGESLTFGGEKYNKIIKNMKCSDEHGGVEVDIVLLNGKSLAIIEVKNRIHPDFVETLAEEKVDNFRKYFPEYANLKAYLGIAGFSFDESVLKDAEEHGIGIIRQVGKSIEMSKYSLKAY